jgi:hypothetical protein
MEDDMQKMFTVGFLILSALAVGGPPAVAECNVHSLKGAYGVKFDGQSAALGRFSSVSIWTFDGKGGMTAEESYNSEETGPQTRTIEGSYEMKPNCSFALFFPSELVQEHEAVGDCVLIDNGKGFYCIDREEGWVTTAVGTKI